MMVDTRVPRLSLCPNCHSAVDRDSLTCGVCGGVLVIETFVSRLKFEVISWAAAIGHALRDRTTLIWTLAATPLLLLPPVLALLLVWKSSKEGPKLDSSTSFLQITLAVCNILLSVMAWRWMSDAVISMGASIGLILKSIGVHHPLGTRI